MITTRPQVPAAAPVRVMLWSADEERGDRRDLCKHLAPAERGGHVRVWHEDHLPAGAHREATFTAEWAQAEVVVVLASQDFLAQGGDEAEGLLRALRAGKPVLPVIVRPCDLSLTRLGQLQAFPRDGRELASLGANDRERALVEAATEILACARRVRDEPPLVGRDVERDELLRAVEKGEPVQLLGLRKMGKTRLLRWAAETLRTLGKPVVFLNASGLEGSSGIHLVRSVAEGLGKLQEIDAALNSRSALPGVEEAAAVLPMLAPSCWLVDDAESLAAEGHGFDKTFFDMLRALGQKQNSEERILWISASEKDLYGRFHETGLTSQFLNHSRKVHVGSICEQDVLNWLARMRFRVDEAEMAWRATGGCVRAVEWVIDHRHALAKGETETARALGEWMRSLFERWWDALEERERALLKAAYEAGRLNAESREGALETLLDRGLLVETARGIELAGVAWRRFVEGR